MLQAGAESHFQAEQLETLREVASEGLEPPSINVWNAARRAGFILDYETAYRGLGMMGAHATLRSLDSYFNTEADGSMQPDSCLITPDQSGCWIWPKAVYAEGFLDAERL